jgi:uncharacterized protein (DUF2236 family)
VSSSGAARPPWPPGWEEFAEARERFFAQLEADAEVRRLKRAFAASDPHLRFDSPQRPNRRPGESWAAAGLYSMMTRQDIGAPRRVIQED